MGVVTVPSSVAFFLFGPLITRVLFFGIGKNDSVYIGYVLSALGVGLVTFSINLILLRGFNAFEDTKTQVLSILFINVIAVALSYLFLTVLPTRFVTVGLGFAFSISYILGLFLTLALLKRHTGSITFGDFSNQHFRLYSAAVIAMLPLFFLSKFFAWSTGSASALLRTFELFFIMVVGLSGYFYLGKLFKVEEITVTAKLLSLQFVALRKSRRNPPATNGE